MSNVKHTNKQGGKQLPKEFTQDEDGVIFRKADTSMKKKLGFGKSLKAMLDDDIIEQAETAMMDNKPELMGEIFATMTELQNLITSLEADEIAKDTLKVIIEKSFDVKAKAGFCNYPLASSFARFMYLYAERFIEKEITLKDINTLTCCMTLLTAVFEREFVGHGENERFDDFWEGEVSPFADT